MAVTLRGVTTVLLPGTGSDDDYLRRAFGPALQRAGARLLTPAPEPADLLAGYRRALEQAAAAGPIAVGGVSLGAAFTAAWAIEHPESTVAVLAALPPWSGAPDRAPAALAALATADHLRRDGLAATVAAMRAASPTWLADELSRSWSAQWPALPEAMEAAAGYRAPTLAELADLRVPLGVAGCPQDAVHPLEVARQWAAAAPRAALATVGLAEFGADPSRLGAASVAALAAIPR